MAISLQDFSKLLIQSKLVSDEQCRQHLAKFAKETGQQDGSAKSAAEWLLKKKIISKYQATVLLAGRPGPFVFGPYKITERIDGGRLNKVFRAAHVSTNHSVLLKLLGGAIVENGRAWNEMLRWVPVTAHPNITRSYEILDQGKNKFLIMQDLRGETFAELLKRSTRIAPDEACRLIRTAAIGLSWLHDHKIVHGDIRPHNLWHEHDKSVKIFVEPEIGTRVFSLADAASESDGVERSDYAAPEFTQPSRTADPLTDIYALGCVFYELLSGRPPFDGGDVNQKLHRHATEPIQPLDTWGVPSALAQRVAYMMAKNPAVRFQSAQVVVDQLAQFAPATTSMPGAPAESTGAAGFESWLQQKKPALPTPPAPVRSPSAAPESPVEKAVGWDSVPTSLPKHPGRLGEPTDDRPSLAAMPSGRSAPQPSPHPPATENGYVPTAVPNAEVSGLPEIEIKRRGKARRKTNLVPFVASLAIVLAVVSVGFVLWKNPSLWRSQETAKNPPDESPDKFVNGKDEKSHDAGDAPSTPTNESSVSSTPPQAGGDAKERATILVDDDGQALWSSPTEGAPINLRYVPPGAQLLLIGRPGEIAASPEGQRILKALGPQFETALATWESLAGVKLDEVEQLIVALYSNPGEFPRSAFVVRLKSDIEPAQYLGKWRQPQVIEGSPGIYQKDNWAYYLAEEDKRTFVMGPFDPLLKDAASAKWETPLLRREISELVQLSDADRHLTLLFTPTFLLGNGRTLFTGDLARALPTFEWLFADSVQAASLSLHFADQFYFELRMESDIEIDRQKLASEVRERISQIPEATELYVANLNPHPYWRLVANRYPGMVRFFYQQSRIGVEGNHAVVNALLPGIAAHNLVFGGEMLLASAPGAAVSAGNTTAAASGPKSIDEILKSKISISFAQDSLEFAMQNVAKEVADAFPNLGFEFKIKILGTDLEKDGITRNQQVREFNQTNTAVADVLTAMVRKANPITTVKEPNELDQKLVWVVGPDPDSPANKIVLVTTRTGVERKKYTLPDVFKPK